MRRWVLASMTAWIGCAATASEPTSRPVPDPELSLLEHRLEPGTCESRLRLFFALHNPRSTPWQLERWEVSVHNGETAITQEAGPLALSVAPGEKRTFDLALAVPRCREATQAMERLSLTGRLFSAAPEELVFEFEDSESLPAYKVPEIQLELRGHRSDDGRVELYLSFALYNPNSYGVAIEALEYSVQLAGQPVAAGRALENERLPHLARTTREIPLDLGAGTAVASALLRKGRTPYEVDTTLIVGDGRKLEKRSGVFSF